ncbi:MAG: response regulator, partial [Vallitaleaceae bacterium]|nr:response regulator [Vallitaleaceae bacterium]
NMSHELRTPLNSILVLSQLLACKGADEPLSDKEKEFANTINSSGKDLLTLINGVLDLSKVEAGKLQVQNEKVYLTEILTENKNMFESMAEMKKIDFKLSIDPGMPKYIVTDSLRINQIMKNLISNSIKFTHEGQVSVRFRNLNDKETKDLMILSGEYIAIEVTDTGIGIPEDKQKEVFEAFKQSDGTTSRQYGGTGLGLTISLELAKLLGGNIHLESEVNKGSKFILVLPRNPITDKKELDIMSAIEIMNDYDVSKEDSNGNKENKVAKITEPSVENEKRILIIEDDTNFAQILSHLAEEKGYVVTKAYTGKDGIKKAKADKPTGIILDIGLPDMDGMILAKMLSEDETTKNIPIHVISGSEDFSDGVGFEGMPKSIIGFLKKPVDIKSIYRTLSKIENADTKGQKKILVVGACGDEDFKKFTQLGQVQIKKVLTGKEAIEELKTQIYGCIILDIKLSDTNGVDFMTKLRQELEIYTPIIIYTEEEINTDDIDDINKYAETIILKSSKSKERLVDEVS